ncbi:6-hydroxymethylpterin diphosphokinase MptE-like protein [Maridesulfovibrio frigidus]|uniref:6-hydroxymethylpterin diphosphokinase MptE-like protein n=1 Tax=Maridesulfovibrio frigidus TaxID=340956 RepID=UPI0004E1BD2E|nr:6-hydroxymethylpterin diphosphokinase MptE-like protein [Maridesulfovibrio frigidus]
MGFITLINTLERYEDESFVIGLGKVKISNDVPRSKKMFFPSVSEKVLEVIKEIDPILLKDGVVLIIGKEGYSSKKRIIDAIQKHLVFLYAKYVAHPRNNETIPDMLGVRKQKTNMMVLREMVRAANFPIHARSPICDKIDAQRIGLPVIILGPGPSLKKILPHLAELKRRALIVCVTRSLPLLREYGISPDFALLLDTAHRMTHFTPHDEKWKDTYLIALSVSNISKIADNFKGVFFFDSYNLNFFPNPYRLRESWLSCVLAALGLAEALHAPDVYLAGMDSCWYDTSLAKQFPASSASSTIYAASGGAEKTADDMPIYPDDEPVLACQDRDVPFNVPDIRGRTATTFFTYFAIAYETELFAEEISKSVGSNFHLLMDQGILNPDVFALGGVEHLKNNYSPLDRGAVHRALDRALLNREKINYDLFIENAKELGAIVDAEACRAGYCLATGDIEGVTKSFLYESLLNSSRSGKFSCLTTIWPDYFPDYLPNLAREFDSLRLNAAVKAGHKWSKLLRQSIAVARLYKDLEAGCPLHVFCLPDEIFEIRSSSEEMYAAYFPGLVVKTITCYVPSAIDDAKHNYPLSGVIVDKSGRGEVSNCLHILIPNYLVLLTEASVSLVSKRLHDEFSYVFDLMPDDKWVLLE